MRFLIPHYSLGKSAVLAKTARLSDIRCFKKNGGGEAEGISRHILKNAAADLLLKYINLKQLKNKNNISW